MSDWLGLSGARVLVAGAGGIGSAAATAFVQAGARVAVADVDENRVAGFDAIVADLSQAESCRHVVTEATELLGGLDVLVHAVGANDRRPVIDTPDEVWHRIIGLNLSSAYWLGQAAGAVMTAKGHGRVVFLSSVSGLLAHRHHGPYAASKGGLNQLMRVMAREWAADGVTVNAVAPGYTETDLTRHYLDKPGMRDEMTSLVPAGRLGAPGDLTGPILFLASEQSAFVTGQVLYVDGGRTLV